MPGARPQKLRSGKGAGGEESCKNGSTSRAWWETRHSVVCSVCGLQYSGSLFENRLAGNCSSEVQRSVAATAAAVVLCCRCRATKRELKHGESHDPPSAEKRSRGRYDVNN